MRRGSGRGRRAFARERKAQTWIFDSTTNRRCWSNCRAHGTRGVRAQGGALGPQSRIPARERRGAAPRRTARDDHSEKIRRPRAAADRRGPRDRANRPALRRDGAHRGRDQYGRAGLRHGLRHRGAAARDRPARARGGRQAGDRHDRARRRHRSDCAQDHGGGMRRRLRRQRQQALDHRRRHFAHQSDFRAHSRPRRNRPGHRRHPRRPGNAGLLHRAGGGRHGAARDSRGRTPVPALRGSGGEPGGARSQGRVQDAHERLQRAAHRRLLGRARHCARGARPGAGLHGKTRSVRRRSSRISRGWTG